MINLNVADGTYSLSAEGLRNMAVDLKDGFIVALGKLEDLSDLSPADLFGKWTDIESGQIFWDKVTHVATVEAATKLGRSIGELAIWDLGKMEEVRL